MGMNKTARMMMINRSGNNGNRKEEYGKDGRRDYSMNERGNYPNDNYNDDYRSGYSYRDRGRYRNEHEHGDERRRMDEHGEYYGGREHRNDYGDRREIRAGGTFWMDNPHKKKFDRKTAEEWVEDMESRDGTKGGKWTYDQTTQVMKQKGFDCDPVDFFVAMNSVFSDFGKTLSKHGVTATDAYAELAYDWVKDPDAHKDKAARYYEYIVK